MVKAINLKIYFFFIYGQTLILNLGIPLMFFFLFVKQISDLEYDGPQRKVKTKKSEQCTKDSLWFHCLIFRRKLERKHQLSFQSRRLLGITNQLLTAIHQSALLMQFATSKKEPLE